MHDLNDHIDRTVDIIDADRRHVLHPMQHWATFAEHGALPIERGDGARLWDTDGNEYLDAIGGMWCTNVGLGNDEMVDAIAAQARQLAYANPFVDVTNVPVAMLATKLATLTPGDLNHFLFTNSGSEAVDSAYRVAGYYQRTLGKPHKRHVISRKDSYHGSTYIAMSLGGKDGDKVEQFEYKTDTIHHVTSTNFFRNGGGRTEQEFADFLVAELVSKVDELGGPETVAAYIAEPIVASGGVVTPPGDYLQRTWEYCTANDILYISDEVVTGFGRCGEWFVSESLFGIRPDLMTMAKGLTSGYIPMGALAISDRVFDVMASSGSYFPHGFTYSGHPVAAAAALKNIEIIETTGLLEHVRDVGRYLEARLKELEDLPMVGEVRGTCFMMCIEFVADKATRRDYPDEIDIGKRVSDALEPKGLMVRPIGNLNVLSPPLVLSRAEVDFIVDASREAIVAVRAELEAAGTS